LPASTFKRRIEIIQAMPSTVLPYLILEAWTGLPGAQGRSFQTWAWWYGQETNGHRKPAGKILPRVLFWEWIIFPHWIKCCDRVVTLSIFMHRRPKDAQRGEQFVDGTNRHIGYRFSLGHPGRMTWSTNNEKIRFFRITPERGFFFSIGGVDGGVRTQRQ